MLVLNIADDLFQKVFHCHKSGRAAVFIGNYRDLDPFVLHHLQYFSCRHTFGDHNDIAHDRPQIKGRIVPVIQVHQITHVNNA